MTSRNHGGDGGPGGSDEKRLKRPVQTKIFEVELSLAGEVPISVITKVLRGQESDQEAQWIKALQILNIILRQNSVEQ